MLHQKWKDILEVVGIFAVVASLLFVGLQIELSQLIADHADVWSEGLIGADLSP